MKTRSEEETKLLIELGEAVVADRLQGLPFGPEELIHQALNYLKKNDSELRQLVCSNPVIKEMFDDERLVHAATLMADILTHKFSGFPCLTISRLLIMQGLKDFCSERWNAEIK